MSFHFENGTWSYFETGRPVSGLGGCYFWSYTKPIAGLQIIDEIKGQCMLVGEGITWSSIRIIELQGDFLQVGCKLCTSSDFKMKIDLQHLFHYHFLWSFQPLYNGGSFKRLSRLMIWIQNYHLNLCHTSAMLLVHIFHNFLTMLTFSNRRVPSSE